QVFWSTLRKVDTPIILVVQHKERRHDRTQSTAVFGSSSIAPFTPVRNRIGQPNTPSPARRGMQYNPLRFATSMYPHNASRSEVPATRTSETVPGANHTTTTRNNPAECEEVPQKSSFAALTDTFATKLHLRAHSIGPSDSVHGNGKGNLSSSNNSIHGMVA